MTLVGRQVYRFADDPAGMMQPGYRLVELDEADKVLVGGVTAPVYLVMHKGRAPGRAEDGSAAAHAHGICRIASQLRVFGRCCRFDNFAAKPCLEADAFAVHIAASRLKYCQRFRIVPEFHARFRENMVGIGLDRLETFL